MCLYMCVHVFTGCMFAGAGGGGFIAGLTKSPSSKTKIQEIINSNKVKEEVAVRRQFTP